MSGVEAIAVVGAVASVVTLLDACNKLSARLKNSRHVPSLISLASRIELVATAVSLLQADTDKEHQNDKLQLCLGEIQSVLVQLEKCLSVLETSPSNNLFKVLSTHKKSHAAFQHFKKLETDLEKYQQTVCLYLLTRMSVRAADPGPKTIEYPPFSSGVPFDRLSLGPKRQQKSACRNGFCQCLCHMSIRQQRALIICTPAHALFRCGCQTKEISVSISALQRILSIQMEADWTQGLSLNWSLHFRNTVRRTSPGFLAIEKCRYGRLNFEQAREELCKLRNANLIDFANVTPDGDGMLEKVIRLPWGVGYRELQFKLIEFLVDAGAPIDSERLLEICLTWVGEGPYIYLLETLMQQSLDASSITPNLFSKWPRAASADWIWPYFSGDPFYLYAISLLTMSDPEFGGTTELQAAVLRKNKLLVESLSKRPNPLNADRNFRGQTVLHLAILNPAMVSHLLSYFPDIDVDAQDDSGTTPLMYAMAYGVTDSSQLLLDAGADSFCSDKLNGFCAWTYALVWTDDKCLAASIEALSTRKPERSRRAVAQCLWSRLLLPSARANDLECKMLAYLAQSLIGCDLISPGGNTLLHLCYPGEAEILLRNKTIPIDQKNSHGYTPLMVITRFQTPPLIRTLVERGAVVDTVDEHGWNALHHLNSSQIAGGYWTVNFDSWQPVMESAAVLLSSGIHLNKGDDCVCPCSLSGCTPLAFLFAPGHWYEPQMMNLEAIPWLLEWLILVQHELTAEAHAALMTLHRHQRFDELGMTHTCCRRRPLSYCYPGYNDQFKKPIDDEFYCEEDKINTDHEGGEIDNTSEQATDAEEIWDEEKFFAEELQRNCDDFSVTASADVEAAWVHVLSRRAVMMEEALSRTKTKRDKRTASARTAWADQTKDISGEIITESPLRYVDHQKDRITECYGLFDVYPTDNLKLQLKHYVEKYLATFRKHQNYVENVIGNCSDLGTWSDRRRNLAAQLLRNVETLREAPDEDRDWDMNVEEG